MEQKQGQQGAARGRGPQGQRQQQQAGLRQEQRRQGQARRQRRRAPRQLKPPSRPHLLHGPPTPPPRGWQTQDPTQAHARPTSRTRLPAGQLTMHHRHDVACASAVHRSPPERAAPRQANQPAASGGSALAGSQRPGRSAACHSTAVQDRRRIPATARRGAPGRPDPTAAPPPHPRRDHAAAPARPGRADPQQRVRRSDQRRHRMHGLGGRGRGQTKGAAAGAKTCPEHTGGQYHRRESMSPESTRQPCAPPYEPPAQPQQPQGRLTAGDRRGQRERTRAQRAHAAGRAARRAYAEVSGLRQRRHLRSVQ